MKRRNNQLEVFSVAAIDLFASAMGAFMLLMLISIPYFGNLSSNPIEQCPVQQACPVCPPVPACPELPQPSPPTQADLAKIAALDLVLVLDITGSMGDEIDSLKSEIIAISKLLVELAETPAIGLVVFGDDGFSRPIQSFSILPVSQLPQLLANFRSIEINMGMGSGDNKFEGESVYKGFVAATNLNWRTDAKQKMIVLITDDVPHALQQQSFAKAVAQFSVQDQQNVAVLTPDEKALQQYYRQITQGGKGLLLTDSDQIPLSSQVILALLKGQ
ncbi:vWA domain-containing protein [Paraferrimonas sp. SM1919]|uniref:vWA domain-containing protein n=1 Tax=Paraferrimonas sp. SM1919 TaxID=2662263 RepID=UPI0013D805CC|nr:vWA domain-containing protein [Paraferrimonas sp. SM1919]